MNDLDENESDDSGDGRLRIGEADETLKVAAIPAMAMWSEVKGVWLSQCILFPEN